MHAVDYLLKPVEPARLADAVARAQARTHSAPARPAPEALAATARPPGRTLDRVLIRQDARVHVIPVQQLDFIEAQDDYLSFATGGKRLRKQQTLTDIEGQLDPARFVRIHRSFLLNVERLARIEPYAKDSWLAILQDGTKLPLSRSGYQRLRELIG